MACPDEAHVAMFVQGELPVADVSRLEAHLDHCEQCLALVAQAADSSARHSGEAAVPSAKDDSVFVHLIAALARRSDRPVANPPSPPERFGPYRVVGVLGRGAMGVVYEGLHQTSGRSVAIKTVASPSPKLLAAMRQEIAFLERQQHPGIVTIFENGVVDGDPWYAMELLRGATLEDFNRGLWQGRSSVARAEPMIRLASPQPPAAGGRLDEVLALFVRMAAPLGFIHRAGIVHCDLKPANIFICGGGQPVLMDFGLLSRAGGAIGRESLEVGGHLRGTLPYLSPELIRGQIPDARADLYALGCILYESVTGRPPFVAKTANGFLEAHLHDDPEPASRLVAGVPPELDQLLAGLLAKRPAERIGDVDVAAERLTRLIRDPDARPRSPRPSMPALFRPRMVGRDEVIERIHALRADALNGHGHLLLISGESGIGKTFLASEIAQRAARARFEVVTGECVPVAPTEQGGREIVGAALEPFRKLLQHAADRCRDAGYDSRIRLFGSERTIRLLARYEPALAHLLGPAGEEDLAPLPPTAERERVLQALTDVLERVAEDAPLLLIIDDLQWADDLSLAFLESLSADVFATRRLLVLGLYRSEETSKALSDLEGKNDVQSFRLERLDSSALTVMVGDLLSDSPPAMFVETLAAHSEGNPFFVAEYLRAAASEGRLERTAAGWRLPVATGEGPSVYADWPLPQSLQALLERRLSSLTPTAQRLAEAAAVLGREQRIAMLTAIVGNTPEEVTRVIDEMVERQVAQRTSKESLRFLHDKTREAAYARLEPDRRRALHLAAANVIEVSYAASSELPAHYAELAYHLQRGGDAGRAVDYFEKAGEHALRRSANVDAVRFFRDAIAVDTANAIGIPADRRALWARKIGDALQGVGDLAGSKEHLLDALSRLGQPMPQTNAKIGLGIARKLFKQIVYRAVPHRWIEADSQQSAALLEIARAYDRLMQIYYYRGEYGPLFFANLSMLDFAERAAASPILAVAYANTAATAGLVPLRGVANTYFRLAETTLGQAYDAEAESYLRALSARYLSGLGKWTEAIAAADRVMALAEDLGFRRRWDEGAGLRSDLSWGRDFDESMMWCNRMLESALRRRDAQATVWGFLRRAEVNVARGDLDLAERSLDEVEPRLTDLGYAEQIRALGLRAIALVARDRLQDATIAADRAAKLIDETKTIHIYCIDAYARIAEVRLAALSTATLPSDPEKAKAKSACETLGKAARLFPIALPRFCLHEGTRRLLRGSRQAAVAMWERGVRTAATLEIPHEEALLLLKLAKYRSPAAANATSSERALQILARLGVEDAATRE